jgi:hypothetical protein
VTVNVDVSDEVLELIASLQARVDNLEEVVYDKGCDCDACNQGEESEPKPFVVIDGRVYINQGYIVNGTIEI